MPYISAITIDFGSTNSGCARIELEQGKQSDYKLPIFLQGSQYYAKDDTWFFVSPSFWKRILKEYEKLSDEDFRIRSRVLPQTEQPTVIWGRQHIKANADMIEKEGWIGFRHFKMNLYHHEDYKIGAQRVPIKEVVRLFLRILKIECLAFEKDRRHRLVSREEIQWGVTIPTIWRDAEKALMTEVASDVFGNHVRILSEPEGPILSELLHSQGDGKFTLKLGRVSLVADLGGGTTDITLLEEVSEDPTCEYPLRVIASLGFLFLICSLIAIGYTLYAWFHGETVAGWASLMISVWFLGSLILIAIGITGEYIGKIYLEVKHRPRYHVEEFLD